MNQVIQKIFSWFLFLTGLTIIFLCLYFSFNIFTGKTSAPEIFKIEDNKILTSTQKKEKIFSGQGDVQKEIEKIVEEQLKEIVPAKTLILFLNLITWSIFAGILIFGGSKISSLGIKLMKK